MALYEREYPEIIPEFEGGGRGDCLAARRLAATELLDYYAQHAGLALARAA